jgi:hypothetical protein
MKSYLYPVAEQCKTNWLGFDHSGQRVRRLGYLKEKGKNLATKEDIEDLAAQTALLTQTAKDIEARRELACVPSPE